MANQRVSKKVSRRTIIKAAAAASALQFTGPFIIKARAAETVKIGLDNPLTGTYAAVGKNELIGCQLAIEQINAKGGILGRQAELLVEPEPTAMADAILRFFVLGDSYFIPGLRREKSKYSWSRLVANIFELCNNPT